MLQTCNEELAGTTKLIFRNGHSSFPARAIAVCHTQHTLPHTTSHWPCLLLLFAKNTRPPQAQISRLCAIAYAFVFLQTIKTFIKLMKTMQLCTTNHKVQCQQMLRLLSSESLGSTWTRAFPSSLFPKLKPMFVGNCMQAALAFATVWHHKRPGSCGL